ncbi:uncharacterized protein LOC100881918 isoform X2 [Megachile rotundata]|uniref:uncharacterized protein LOC100881918 isoform X2 n=1 Tax=Megachile rotundata TaxID=143995 RepID=UPI003FD1A3EB
MNERRAECVLSILYVSSAIFSCISLVCLAAVWQYWAQILNVCISIDCGCILYGINTFRTFMGGDAKLCHFGVYGLIPTLLIGICLGAYHGHRSCVGRNLEEPVRMYDQVARYGYVRANLYLPLRTCPHILVITRWKIKLEKWIQKLEHRRRSDADGSGQVEKEKSVQAMDTQRVSRGFTLLFIVGTRGRNDRRLLQNLRALQEKADTSFRFERSRSRGDTPETLVRSNFRLYGLFTV